MAEPDWVAVGSSPPWTEQELEQLRQALEQAGLVVSLVPDVHGGEWRELRVRPKDLDVARQIVLGISNPSG